MIEKAIILVLTGIIVGVVNSVAGGGILVGFPVILFFGLSALVSNATSNVVTVTGQMTSSFGYRKQLKKLPLSYFWLLIPSLIGGIIGAYILRRTSSSSFLIIAPGLIMVAVILFAFQPYIKARIYRSPQVNRKEDKPSVYIFPLIFLLSIYGGYFGAGFGLVTLAILSLTKIKSIHEMNGLKNLCALVICFSDIAILVY